MGCLLCRRFWTILAKGALTFFLALFFSTACAYWGLVVSVEFWEDEPHCLCLKSPAFTTQTWELDYRYPTTELTWWERMFYVLGDVHCRLRQSGVMPENVGPTVRMDAYSP